MTSKLRTLNEEQRRAIEDIVAVVADEVYNLTPMIIDTIEKMDRSREPLGATLEHHTLSTLETELHNISSYLFGGFVRKIGYDAKFIFDHACKVLRKN